MFNTNNLCQSEVIIVNEETLQNIKQIIEIRGYKKKAVAERMRYKENQFSDLLNGRRAVKLDDIIQLCEILEVEPNDLIKQPGRKTA